MSQNNCLQNRRVEYTRKLNPKEHFNGDTIHTSDGFDASNAPHIRDGKLMKYISTGKTFFNVLIQANCMGIICKQNSIENRHLPQEKGCYFI